MESPRCLATCLTTSQWLREPEVANLSSSELSGLLVARLSTRLSSTVVDLTSRWTTDPDTLTDVVAGNTAGRGEASVGWRPCTGPWRTLS